VGAGIIGNQAKKAGNFRDVREEFQRIDFPLTNSEKTLLDGGTEQPLMA
jgi:hypothetical protein